MKIKKFFLIVTMFLSIFMVQNFAWADVGSFEDYGSGGDSSWDSDSDWDSDSSWSSSYGGYDYDYDDGYSYGSSSNRRYSTFDFTAIFIAIMVMTIIMFIIKSKKAQKARQTNFNVTTKTTEYHDKLIEDKVKEKDPDFNAEEFTSFARDVFVKLQNAWTERDWEKIRPFESKELFEQHKMQLEGYIKNNQINVLERICVNWVHLTSFEQYGGNDILKVDLNSRMGDYIIDAKTNKVLRGDKTKEYYHTYTLTFIRKTGSLTPKDESGLNTTNCPNCGAPTVVTSSGRCEYCNSVITTDDYGWVLSNLSRKN